MALATLVIGIAACGGDQGDTSLVDLKERLPAAKVHGLESERGFEWDKATDFVAQGVFYSEGTKPSELIGAIDDAGFNGGVGAVFSDPKRQSHLWVMAAEFDSDEGALKARERLHAEDLKQPYFAGCAVTPQEYEIEGIPDSDAVHAVPMEGKPPPGLFKSETYLLEFTVGPQLYIAAVDGPPGYTSDEEFDEMANAVYEQATAG